VKPEDRKAFLEVVIGFAELKGKALSAPALELYWRSMQHWPLDDFRAAAQQLVRTSEFMPTPKDFEDLRKAGRKTPGEAWLAAVETSRRMAYNDRGPSRYVNTSGDELIDRAVQMIGGYDAIRMCHTDKLHFLERRFAEHFGELRDVSEVREAVPELAGPESFARIGTGGLKSAAELLPRLPQ
jgi:hypothetical protein